ncbi:diguanylate cyclase [Mesorhizobium albiziae]|uniref:Diguanylate cyclase n=1 Tax=Neomesorhizobium albiziae TaxID=335020 RepID=A0A1I3ZAV9_9HYPH|nr:GGDEF domain-containing protein [Mesorhizobium albiziae]GLS32122.1 GGDEF domain-containing protein [Mesorhizobium albiziae]SFK41234.1 diguanylate cyclase [Mesorhizobium albiziae]
MHGTDTKPFGLFRKLASQAFLWLSSTGTPEQLDIRLRLAQTVNQRKIALVVGSISIAVSALTAAVVTGQLWPYFWLMADLALVLIRFALIARSEGGKTYNPDRLMAQLMLAGGIWSALLGMACLLCVTSGNGLLVAQAGMNVAGVVGAVSSRNAATPRFGGLVMALVGVPYAVAALMSAHTGTFVLGLQVLICLPGMYAIMLQNHNVTLRMVKAEHLNLQLAMTDVLTGLPNRMFLEDKLDKMCAVFDNKGAVRSFGLLYLDLDGFKPINDAFGHAAGDTLLKAVARRLVHVTRENDSACRLGGDEFVILLPGATSVETALLAKRVINAISRPFEIGVGRLVHIGTSVGSVTAPADGCEPTVLMANADRALYAAKATGKGKYRSHATASS